MSFFVRISGGRFESVYEQKEKERKKNMKNKVKALLVKKSEGIDGLLGYVGNGT